MNSSKAKLTDLLSVLETEYAMSLRGAFFPIVITETLGHYGMGIIAGGQVRIASSMQGDDMKVVIEEIKKLVSSDKKKYFKTKKLTDHQLKGYREQLSAKDKLTRIIYSK